MNKKTKIYYSILFLILGIKIVTTIFSNGLSVHHGKKISQLQIQKHNLTQQQLRLNAELSNKTSLLKISENYDTSEYINISKPLVLNPTTAVASN
jgi:hypothetical protein